LKAEQLGWWIDYVVAEMLAEQTRSQQADPELEQIMASTAHSGSGTFGFGHVERTRRNLVEQESSPVFMRPARGLECRSRAALRHRRHAAARRPVRLISRGLIVGIGQRGFRVADVSREDPGDITRIRTVIEIEALRLAMALGDDAWKRVS